MGNQSSNVTWQDAVIDRSKRETLNGHRSLVLWFTGLSGAGKSSLARAVEDALYLQSKRTYVLDGDNIRHGLCGDLDFSAQGRNENIRRVSEVAKLFVDANVIVLTAFISPFRIDRERAKALIGATDFLEIYCRCRLDVCEERDVKGLYKLARAGKIADFTGITSPYEEPIFPDLVVNTDVESVEACVQLIIKALQERGFA
jgi:adenylylsulfate kinase